MTDIDELERLYVASQDPGGRAADRGYRRIVWERSAVNAAPALLRELRACRDLLAVLDRVEFPSSMPAEWVAAINEAAQQAKAAR